MSEVWFWIVNVVQFTTIYSWNEQKGKMRNNFQFFSVTSIAKIVCNFHPDTEHEKKSFMSSLEYREFFNCWKLYWRNLEKLENLDPWFYIDPIKNFEWKPINEQLEFKTDSEQMNLEEAPHRMQILNKSLYR